ncbi:MAG: hypothetical protein ACU0CI_00310 [Shimia sp.]
MQVDPACGTLAWGSLFGGSADIEAEGAIAAYDFDWAGVAAGVERAISYGQFGTGVGGIALG